MPTSRESSPRLTNRLERTGEDASRSAWAFGGLMDWEKLTDKELADKAELGQTGQGSITETTRRLGKEIEALSALLTRLSKESAETADKNLEAANKNLVLQGRIICLTWLILGVSVLMLVFSGIQIFSHFPENPQRIPSEKRAIQPHQERKPHYEYQEQVQG